jgi:hypothetical protein
MTCEEARDRLALLVYSELSLDEEEAVEQHLESCAECRGELARLRSVEQALDQRELDVSPFLLRRCRERLAEQLAGERARSGVGARLKHGWARLFGGSGWTAWIARPAGAMALVSLGFFVARVGPLSTGGLNSAGVLDPGGARVRYVESAPGGEVQLVVDETRQRVISGRVDDARIRRLLLAAAKDPADPGLRVESVELLKGELDSDDVRNALVYAFEHDPNAGVRLKALDGLKPYASEPDVRKALSRALLNDDNPGIRTQAIDLLTHNAKEQQLIGVLQELLHREENSYIRMRCQKALHEMKASAETY